MESKVAQNTHINFLFVDWIYRLQYILNAKYRLA